MVECARLEIWFTVHRNVGSNPTLSTKTTYETAGTCPGFTYDGGVI